MAFLVSPGVNTSEIDLTTAVPAVGTSTGATVGLFRWGPANVVVQVTSEPDLVEKFSTPNSDTAVSFLSAANFLSYGNDLRVVRAVSTAAVDRANNATANGSHTVLILNDDDYFTNQYNGANTFTAFAARYPGALGNSLKISVCGSEDAFTGAGNTANAWAYAP